MKMISDFLSSFFFFSCSSPGGKQNSNSLNDFRLHFSISPKNGWQFSFAIGKTNFKFVFCFSFPFPSLFPVWSSSLPLLWYLWVVLNACRGLKVAFYLKWLWFVHSNSFNNSNSFNSTSWYGWFVEGFLVLKDNYSSLCWSMKFLLIYSF